MEARLLKSSPIVLACLLCAGLTAVRAAEPPGPAVTPPPTPQELLGDMVARLPREALTVGGDLILRKRHGVVLTECKFEMKLNWGGQPPSAVYTIMDALGSTLETMTVTRPEGKSLAFKYTRGAADEPAPMPDLYSPIQDTDITWADLTLDFAWWTPTRIVGHEEVRGRACTIVEVRPPSAAAATGRRYATVQLWIDDALKVMLQARGLDAQGKEVRTLWIKGVKKINDRWMIKEMEIQSSPAHRTKLVVDMVNHAPVEPEGDKAGK